MKKSVFSIVVVVLIVVVGIYVFLPSIGEENVDVENFYDCVEAGYPAMESYPRQCMANGITFVEESCQSGGNILTIEGARQIAMRSECGDRLKETYFCNENTGTYWIDLNIERRGCNPACVIDLKTRRAVINWRCTGLIEA